MAPFYCIAWHALASSIMLTAFARRALFPSGTGARDYIRAAHCTLHSSARAAPNNCQFKASCNGVASSGSTLRQSSKSFEFLSCGGIRVTQDPLGTGLSPHNAPRMWWSFCVQWAHLHAYEVADCLCQDFDNRVVAKARGYSKTFSHDKLLKAFGPVFQPFHVSSLIEQAGPLHEGIL